LKPFIVPQATFKGQGHRQCHPLLDRPDILSENEKYDTLIVRQQQLKWPWRSIEVIGDRTVQYATHRSTIRLLVCSNH